MTGDKDCEDYPFGYGFCQCGCGRKTGKLRNGRFATYVSGHHPSARQRAKYKDENNPKSSTSPKVTYKPPRFSRTLAEGNEGFEEGTERLLPTTDDRSRESVYATAPAYIRRDQITWSTITDQHLHRLYNEHEMTVKEMARQFDRHTRTIYARMSRAGIVARRPAESRTIRLNSDFFGTWSPGMAWVLGLCFTDGYFRNNQVRLALKDRETLEKVRALIGEYLDIKEQKQSYDKENTIFTLTFGNEQMAKDLQNLGLTNNKSLTMSFPDVPADLISHFIRGCWDGDGGFTCTKDGVFSGHYTCGSEGFINQLAFSLFDAGVVRRILRRMPAEEMNELRARYGAGPYPLRVYKRRVANAFDLRITSFDMLTRFFNFLYRHSDSSIRMERKYAFSCGRFQA